MLPGGHCRTSPFFGWCFPVYLICCNSCYELWILFKDVKVDLPTFLQWVAKEHFEEHQRYKPSDRTSQEPETLRRASWRRKQLFTGSLSICEDAAWKEGRAYVAAICADHNEICWIKTLGLYQVHMLIGGGTSLNPVRSALIDPSFLINPIARKRFRVTQKGRKGHKQSTSSIERRIWIIGPLPLPR